MNAQADTDPGAGPFHSFKVTHVIRAGGGTPGSSEVQSGHLSGADAIKWITGIAFDNDLPMNIYIDPAHGVPPELAESLALEGTSAAATAAAGQLHPDAPTEGAEAASGPPGAAEGAPDDPATD